MDKGKVNRDWVPDRNQIKRWHKMRIEGYVKKGGGPSITNPKKKELQNYDFAYFFFAQT